MPGSPPTRSPPPRSPPPPSASAPGPLVRVLFAECTNADAGFDAERLDDEFPGMIEAEGALLDDLPERLDRFHYDLVATTTFHGEEAQALVAGRVPVVAMLVGPGYVELVHEIAGLPRGSRVGLICASERGADNIRETLKIAGTRDVDIVTALLGADDELTVVDRTADLILMSREAMAAGLEGRLSRPDRIRAGPTSSTRPASSSCDERSSTSPPPGPIDPTTRPVEVAPT